LVCYGSVVCTPVSGSGCVLLHPSFHVFSPVFDRLFLFFLFGVCFQFWWPCLLPNAVRDFVETDRQTCVHVRMCFFFGVCFCSAVLIGKQVPKPSQSCGTFSSTLVTPICEYNLNHGCLFSEFRLVNSSLRSAIR